MSLDTPLASDAGVATADAVLPAAVAAGDRRRRFRDSLIARLLGLAAGFVLLTEIMVFVPALAAFRTQWLSERFDTGELTVLAGMAPVSDGFSRADPEELLQAAHILSVRSLPPRGGSRLLAGRAGAPADLVVEPERQAWGAGIGEALKTLVAPTGRRIAIVGRPRANAAIKLEVVVEEAPLKAAMLREMWRVLASSLALAVLITALIYAALAEGFVRPMRRLTLAITRFRAAPEDASRALRPSGRRDEIGRAEDAFADMQETVRAAFSQRERLAQLGMAVSRIAHDLRHSLGSAQLVGERLSAVDDPVVKATAPRLERALRRAADLAEATLRWGKAGERPPIPARIDLDGALTEAADEALARHTARLTRDIPPGLSARVDPDHLHRILVNLLRNAAEAMANSGKGGEVAVRAVMAGGRVRVTIADDGPGLPAKVQAHLFAPFTAGAAHGSTGLGLAIAHDLARMNGGALVLEATGGTGSRFGLELPVPEPGPAGRSDPPAAAQPAPVAAG